MHDHIDITVNVTRGNETRKAKVVSIRSYMDKNEMVFDTEFDVPLKEGEKIRHRTSSYPSRVFRKYMSLWGWKKLSQRRLELITKMRPKTIEVRPIWSSQEEGLIYLVMMSEKDIGDWLEAVDRKAYKHV